MTTAMGERTVLIVDDDDMLREAMVFDFKRKGFRVLEANDGRQAFEIVKAERVGVILSDVRMPGGTGIELQQWIAALGGEAPRLIFIAGYSDLSVEEAFDRGAVAVFPKPYDRRALFETVDKAFVVLEKLWESEIPVLKDSRPILGEVVSLGLGGVSIVLREGKPEPDMAVRFELKIADQDTVRDLKGSGIVRWSRAGHCGVEFVFLEEPGRSSVIQTIRRGTPNSFIPKYLGPKHPG